MASILPVRLSTWFPSPEINSSLANSATLFTLPKELVATRHRCYALFFTLLGILAIAKLLRHSFLRAKPRVDVPVLNLENTSHETAAKQWMYNYEELLHAGYKRFKHEVYQLWTPDGFVIVLSPDFLPEIRQLPDSICDFYSGVKESLLGEYKFLDLSGVLPIVGLKKNVTASLGETIPSFMEELLVAFPVVFSIGKEWSPLTVMPAMERIAVPTVGRVFVGHEICRLPSYIETQIAFGASVLGAAIKLRKTPHIFKPLMALFVPEIYRSLKCLRDIKKLLVPVIKARFAKHKAGGERTEDLVQFVMEGAEFEPKPTSIPRQAEQALIFSFGGVAAISTAMAQVLYDMAEHSHHIQPIRDEVNEIWDECDGQFTRAHLQRMVKMDSFFKESQRLNPANSTTINRLMRADFTLSNGLTLPKGSRFCVPASQVSLDPEVWEDPYEFDGFRYETLRNEKPENISQMQFPTPTTHSLHFGTGRHVCPGRFLAVVQMKLVTAVILRHYDFKLQDGETKRPHNVNFGPINTPSHIAKLDFRQIRELPAPRGSSS
ncbi:hypothetical protein BLS_001499 [Venturia inaequalis]|uniref:Cytochrome P450 n=1 Tax=Venturia inaequalis TaxID=5025 RepID=A0A8H3UVV7_VENIN|nr:hypothetical protein BLS_001499 [Venturia inaequalis]KAE9985449.1 hypothetical protein EG328_007441 [Venturia inaequalis]KAE9994735.1 hypothetical protein EG327_002999 [Venturia inaequalis]RDI81850.1 hypothetical protein Vi05172_g8271 [Venturia inaequalis]